MTQHHINLDQTERATARINDGIWRAALAIDEQTARLIAHAFSTDEGSALSRFALQGAVDADALLQELAALQLKSPQTIWRYELIRYLHEGLAGLTVTMADSSDAGRPVEEARTRKNAGQKVK